MAGESRSETSHAAIVCLNEHQNADLAPLAAELLWKANRTEQTEAFVAATLPGMLLPSGGDYLALVAARGGQWTLLGQIGQSRSLPTDLLADSLDTERAQADENWAVAPLYRHAATAELIVVHHEASKSQVEAPLHFVEIIGPVLGQCLSIIRERYIQNRARDRRLHRLEAIVRIAQAWNRNHEVEPLLADMAHAATRLLEADRASIFLWDRANHTLVGRPALGIEEGELRIADDAGVVGQVIRSGKPRRVESELEPNQIDHDVDSRFD